MPASGDFDGGTRVHFVGQYLGASLSDVVSVMLGNNPCVDLHWTSALDIDCLSTNEVRNEGPVKVSVITVIGGASMFGSQDLVFSFDRGLILDVA